MTKKEYQIPIGDRVRRRTVLSDDPSVSGTDHSRIRLHQFLQEVLDTPGLMQCGLATPQRLAMYHDGQSWVLDMEAEEAQEQ